jgi:hypothetical protein
VILTTTVQYALRSVQANARALSAFRWNGVTSLLGGYLIDSQMSFAMSCKVLMT